MNRQFQHETEVLATHTPELFKSAIEKASSVLRKGGIVALPTETVYGLAANAYDPEAVGQIFNAKGRPTENPIIVHVTSIEMARECVAEWPALAQQLADAFWPGPLTLVLSKSDRIPAIVTAGGRTVGIRWPAHPIVQGVIRACGFPLAAPSANLSSRLSPTTAAHVLRQLRGRIPLIIDGGQCNVGLESTVLDVSGAAPRILRPGMVGEGVLMRVVGQLSGGAAGTQQGVLKSPGNLPKHYSPNARLEVRAWQTPEQLRALLSEVGEIESNVAIVAHTVLPNPGKFRRVSIVPKDPEAYARALYAELHECDESGARLILVEDPPEGPEWRAARDRLTRAAGRSAA